MRALILALTLVACSSAEEEAEVLDGPLGFGVTGAIALECPLDSQGLFMKVFIEGSVPSTTCNMDQARQIPLTCEDRRAYLEAVPGVCLGQNAVAGPNLPMLDYLLEIQEDGSITDFGVVPYIDCQDGDEHAGVLWGETSVAQVDDQTLQLDFDLTNEDEDEDLLSGTVQVEICPPPN